MGELLAFFETYLNNADKFSSIAISIFVLGGYLGLSEFFEDKALRTIMLIPPALLLVFFSAGGDAFSQEFFLNVASQLLLAFAAVIIAVVADTLESWTFAMVGAFTFALIFVVFVAGDNPRTSLLMNLGTGLVGAFLIARLLNKEWKWSPEGRVDELWKSRRQVLKEREQRQAEVGDYFMLIAGADEGELQQRIDFLKEHDMSVVHDRGIERDEQTGDFYQLINVKIETVVKDQDTMFLRANQARIRVLAYPDTVKTVVKQMQEMLELEQPQRIESPAGEMVHIETKAVAPKRMFSTYLEESLFSLAREWRASGDEHLEHAATDLMEWATEMQFVKT